MRTRDFIAFLALMLFCGVCIGALLQRSCSKPPETTTDTTFITQIIPGDTVLYPVVVKVPTPIYIDTGSTHHHYYPVDTPAILADYFRVRYYSDTIYQPDNFRAVIKDSVNFNRIIWRAVDHQNLKATSIFTTQITHSEANKPAWMLGVDGIFNSQRVYLGPSILYRTRYDHYFKLGIHFAYDTPAAISMGYYKQIHIKK
jgi:hypothetical protein